MGLTGFPLADLDDHLVHQTSRPFSRAGNDEPEWFEHGWFILIPPDPGCPLIESNLTLHPNTNMMHAYVIAQLGEQQYTFRGGRTIGSDRTDMRIGPMVHIARTPFKSWQLVLEPHPDVPLSIEAEMEATHPPQLWPRIEYFEAGSMYHAQTEIVQLFQVTSGSLDTGGRTWDLAGWRCVRDHCWGYRPLSRVTPVHTWVPAFFEDRAVLLWHTEDADGNPLHHFAQIFLPDGTILNSDETQITYMDEQQSHFEWSFETSDGVQHRLKGDKAGKHGVMHQAGWSGERDTDYYGPYKVEGLRTDLEEVTKQLMPSGRGYLGHWYANYVLDDVHTGSGVLAHYALSVPGRMAGQSRR
jgi:hypothetical protein